MHYPVPVCLDLRCLLDAGWIGMVFGDSEGLPLHKSAHAHAVLYRECLQGHDLFFEAFEAKELAARYEWLK